MLASVQVQPLGQPTWADGDQHGYIEIVRMLFETTISEEFRRYFIARACQYLPSQYSFANLAQERVGCQRPARPAAPNDCAWSPRV